MSRPEPGLGSRMVKCGHRGAAIAGCLVSLGAAAFHAGNAFPAATSAGFFVPSPGHNDERSLGVDERDSDSSFKDYREQIIDSAGQVSVHSATLTNLPDGGIGAFWYGGSREGGKDVQIYFARMNPQSEKFSEARSVMSVRLLSSQLGRYIKKLGNPSAVMDQAGRLWLFFVSVSLGGWSGSAVNFMISDDGGDTWSTSQRLVTSPFFNVSTLVRTPAVPLKGGGLALPVYHELFGKFSEVLVVGPDGDVRDKIRLTWGRDAIQPSLVPTAPGEGVVLMRHGGDPPARMLRSVTKDGGSTYSTASPTALPNSDSSVAGSVLPDASGIWIVHNGSEVGRNVLSIAVADHDGQGAVRVMDLESGPSGSEFSYPAILTDARGRHHVAWTHNRKNIKHAVFNDAWLFDAVKSGHALK